MQTLYQIEVGTGRLVAAIESSEALPDDALYCWRVAPQSVSPSTHFYRAATSTFEPLSEPDAPPPLVAPTAQTPAQVAAAEAQRLADVKLHCLERIDAAAGRARARYITISPGQEATYLRKVQQAESWQAAGFVGSAPSFVQAEIDATGQTGQQAVAAILAQQAAWDVKGGQIESARRTAKVAVVAWVGSVPDLIAATDGFCTTLDSL